VQQVTQRQREAEAGCEHRPQQEPDIQLVHQRAGETVEAHDRGDVQVIRELSHFHLHQLRVFVLIDRSSYRGVDHLFSSASI
jgi:hypothetical protein